MMNSLYYQISSFLNFISLPNNINSAKKSQGFVHVMDWSIMLVSCLNEYSLPYQFCKIEKLHEILGPNYDYNNI